MHEQTNERLTREQCATEALLAGLTPAAGERSPATVMYKLGEQAGRRSARRWRAASACASLLLAASVALQIGGHAVDENARVAAEQQPGPAPHADRLHADRPPAPPLEQRLALPHARTAEPVQRRREVDPSSLGHLRAVVARDGIDALPEQPLGLVAEPAITREDLF
ncbi:MAG: hypothetical protein WD009_02095 [Phycisphaeraceae bacterium]